jgi:hypothetical protein
MSALRRPHANDCRHSILLIQPTETELSPTERDGLDRSHVTGHPRDESDLQIEVVRFELPRVLDHDEALEFERRRAPGVLEEPAYHRPGVVEGWIDPAMSRDPAHGLRTDHDLPRIDSSALEVLDALFYDLQVLRALCDLRFQLRLSEAEHGAELRGGHFLVHQSFDLCKGEAEIAENQDSIEVVELGSVVEPVSSRGIDVARPQEAELIVVPEQAARDLGNARELSDPEHDASLLLLVAELM